MSTPARLGGEELIVGSTAHLGPRSASPRDGYRATPDTRPGCTPWARLHRSGRYREAASGAVCAGSNPAGGAGRGDNSNTLTILVAFDLEAVACDDAAADPFLRPIRARRSGPRPDLCWSTANGRNGLQAVAAGPGRCWCRHS